MGNACRSKMRRALPSSRPPQLEAHVFLVLSNTLVVPVLYCPANMDDSLRDICGTATQIAVSETKLKDVHIKKKLLKFSPDWFAYKNGHTCLVEEIDIEERRPFSPFYGPPFISPATFIFAAREVDHFKDREQRQGHEQGEFFGPFGRIDRPDLGPHFYIREKGDKIACFEGQKVNVDSAKPLTFLAKVMLGRHAAATTANAECVLSATQLAHENTERRCWKPVDVIKYFDQLQARGLGTRREVLQGELLAERKANGITHISPDSFFFKRVKGKQQLLSLHKLGLELQVESGGTNVIVPRLTLKKEN